MTYRHIVLAALGNKCTRCGYADERALCLDHVRGDGHRENRSSRSRYRKAIARGIPSDRYQLLCANCNLIKAKENGELRKAYEAEGEPEQEHQLGHISQLTEHKARRIAKKQPIGFQLTSPRKRKPVTLEE